MNTENILATIAGEAITEKDFEAYLDNLPKEQKAYASNPYFRNQILEQVINTRLMTKLAMDQKLDESEEFQQKMNAIRNDLLAQAAIQALVDSVTVSDEEAEQYFSENKEAFMKDETVSARHILVDSEEECARIAEDIRSGSLSFQDAAAKYSSCPSKAKGGDLGEFGHGQMVKEFDEAAFAAEVDSITDPVKTQFGYHLIQVYAKSEASVPEYADIAASVKNRLLNERKNTAVQTTLSDLRERYLNK